MQSLANQAAVRIREEFKLSPSQHRASEWLIYRLTDRPGDHSHEEAERWVRDLVKSLKA